jgi:foldase protein PrsA
VIARVAGRPIHEATVVAWARAIEAGSAAGPAWAPPHAGARERALDYLISAHWLIGEAAQRGLRVSARAMKRSISERIEVAPRGREEFQGSAGEQTIPELTLEVQAELAAARLRTMVLSSVAPVTHAEVVAYYKRHRAIFHVRQRRQVDLVEGLPSRSAAIALGRHLGTGARFASRAEHELVQSTAPYEASTPEFNTGLLHAIFAARPGRLSGPVSFNDAWTLLVVRRVEPGEFIPLATIEPWISKRLLDGRRRRALARFAGPYSAKWRSRTSCSVRFVVAKCKQYRGPAQNEGDPLAPS